uniref:Protein naked cuticle homolog n=1 Tax=Anopheles melas TaxID=34690 RepID=A0A182TZP8_9DIPT
GQTKTSFQHSHHHHHHGHHHQSPSANGHNHSGTSHQQQQQQQQHHHHHKSQKDAFRKCTNGKAGGGNAAAGGASGAGATNTINTTAATIRSDPDRVRLEDIAGIVSTIYESIGKSVVVPHYGSKTINVRLTVSPDGKTATTKPASAAVKKAIITPRDNQVNRSVGLSNSSEGSSAVGQLLVEAYHKNNLSPGAANAGAGKGVLNNAPNATKSKTNENVYESINNLKCSTGLNQSTTSTAALICPDCVDGGAPTATLLPPLSTLETVVIPAPSAGVAGRAKRKLVRKTRASRKTAIAAKMMSEDFARRPRARSLSVGNENCYENVIGRMAAAQEECWKSSLCRRELIEIIRESMVKNSLCFQPNRKANDSSPKHRHRSHTIASRVGDQGIIEPLKPKHRHRSHTIASRVGDQVFFNYHHPTAAALMAANTGATMAADLGGAQATATTTTTTALVAMAGHEANLCGYDSYLHNTICAAAANGGVGAATAMHLTTAHAASATAAINGGVQALATSTPNRLLQHHFHHSKLKSRKEHHRLAVAVGATRSTQPTPVKLSTALLNQQYPNLSAEQKLTRSINQVEQWLDHRSPKLVPKVKLADDMQLQRTVVSRPLKRSKSKEELTPSNLLLLENLKISEDIAEIAVVTPKKVFNKESLIASATKKNIKTHHQHQHSPSRQPTAVPTVAIGAEKPSAPLTVVNKQSIPAGDAQLVQLQYGSVPINADPSECENLIRMSDDGDDVEQQQQQQHQQQQQAAPMAATKHSYRHHQPQSRSQPQSPQHHQHHHQQEPRYCGSGRAHSVSSASAASTTAVHRYVHEHIHHHYHHFENDPDES